MGCGKSKIKRISLTPDNLNEDQFQNGIDTISGKVNGEVNRPKSSGLELGHNGIIPGETRSEDEEEPTILPNRLLLSAIPVSDLGDSLDSRHLSESLNKTHSYINNPINRIKGDYFYFFVLLTYYCWYFTSTRAV